MSVGPDVGTLKGKTVRKKSPIVKNDLIEIPPEILEQHQDLVLEIDIMFVNGMPMLTSIVTTIKFRSLVPLKDQTAEELYKALDVVLRKYNKNKFKVNKINCDQQFKPLMKDVEDSMGIWMNCAPRDEHVPAAERNNCTISEPIRVTYHSLPYKAMPKTMLWHLAMISAWLCHPLPKTTPPAHGPMASRPRTNEKELALLDPPHTSRSSVCPTRGWKLHSTSLTHVQLRCRGQWSTGSCCVCRSGSSAGKCEERHLLHHLVPTSRGTHCGTTASNNLHGTPPHTRSVGEGLV